MGWSLGTVNTGCQEPGRQRHVPGEASNRSTYWEEEHPPPFGGAGGPTDGPASLGSGHRPDHDAPIPVITRPIFLNTIDRSG